MLKANKNTLIITSIITLLPMGIGLFFWNRLPDTMATHFGPDNVPNGFSSKPFSVFGIPLFCLAMLWLAAFITSHDPRKQNISSKIFTLILWIVSIVSLIAAAIMYPFNLCFSFDITLIMEMLLGLMFVILGNYLPKIRQNYTIGIRIPWTLANEENWNRTHRFAGYLWVFSGIVLIILGLTKLLPPIWSLLVLTFMVLIPCLYSYHLHVKKNL